jgi:hypothetical protein
MSGTQHQSTGPIDVVSASTDWGRVTSQGAAKDDDPRASPSGDAGEIVDVSRVCADNEIAGDDEREITIVAS